MRTVASSVILLVVLATGCGYAQSLKTAHLRMTYSGADERWAKALAEIVEAARSIYIEDLGFDMPEQLRLETKYDAQLKPVLKTEFLNAQVTIVLRVGSRAEFTKPPTAQALGMCHELGHVAMYRILGTADWMRGEANEAWAVYIGSVVVDRLYKEKGESFWPDHYDYRRDGPRHLEQNRLSSLPVWQEIGQVIGDSAFHRLFTAWSNAAREQLERRPALGEALCGIDAAHSARLRELWKTAAPILVVPSQEQIVLDATRLDNYTGIYRFEGGSQLAITREGSRLFLQQAEQPTIHQPKMEMFAEGERDFFLKYIDAKVTFETEHSRATTILVHLGGHELRAKRID